MRDWTLVGSSQFGSCEHSHMLDALFAWTSKARFWDIEKLGFAP